MIKTIIDMFSYKRPMGGATEQLFVNKFIAPAGFKRDVYQNMVLTIGDNPRVLFSSHMDTVHQSDGFNKPVFKDGFLTQTYSNCLGADDTAGVWLMLEMVKAQIPGVYIIHYGEERGGIGSRAKAKGQPEFFRDIDIAIAFDRMGYNDIITHQGVRTASDDFAWSFAKELGGSYRPSDEGMYTDTYEYAHLVAECTNVSVGYFNQHRESETQDVTFLMALREALLQVNWTNLIVARDPEHFVEWNMKSAISQDATLYEMVTEYPDVAVQILEAYRLSPVEFMEIVEETYGRDAA
ncbi:hypothetical protein AX761_23860 [Rhizobium sp. 58]|nr:hypothetical protein AX761_23860 [Rhizobium sp. 58]